MRTRQGTICRRRESEIISGEGYKQGSRRDAGFSMVELLVSISLMSLMTAVLLQSFIVAKRLNARVSTEQRIQSLAETTMESMKAADLSLAELAKAAKNGGVYAADGITYRVKQKNNGISLIYNDIGNGRGPVVSFGNQYAVAVEIDPQPYSGRGHINTRDRRDLVTSFNSRSLTADANESQAGREMLVQLKVIVYRMEERLAEDGPEKMRLETARIVRAAE
ncbi:MAG: type II secretion system GspH family protein [Lachnospiraceae bacterium]|nr:type II secretion system GspH family protein [Lachnospiraceae bacterium]